MMAQRLEATDHVYIPIQGLPRWLSGKESACNAGDVGLILELRRSPGKATHSSILAWEIPWTKEPGELQSLGLQKLATTQQLTTMLLLLLSHFQSCPTLCDPIDGSPPGSPAPGILQARTLEWVAISFSNAGK